MRPIPPKLKREILEDPFYEKCIRHHEGECKGRITWEHPWTYGGKQINEKWAIVPCCAYHHGVDEYMDRGKMDKQVNQLVALLRATPEDLKKYPRIDWEQEKKRLLFIVRKRYGDKYISTIISNTSKKD